MRYRGGEVGFSYGAFAVIFLGLLVGHGDSWFELEVEGLVEYDCQSRPEQQRFGKVMKGW